MPKDTLLRIDKVQDSVSFNLLSRSEDYKLVNLSQLFEYSHSMRPDINRKREFLGCPHQQLSITGSIKAIIDRQYGVFQLHNESSFGFVTLHSFKPQLVHFGVVGDILLLELLQCLDRYIYVVLYVRFTLV